MNTQHAVNGKSREFEGSVKSRADSLDAARARALRFFPEERRAQLARSVSGHEEQEVLGVYPTK